ncbi:hypothetical protein IscW_ISCW001612, partial [Ixodes scapularis]
LSLSVMSLKIEILPEIVSAVRGRAEVYVDGGVLVEPTWSRRCHSEPKPCSLVVPPSGCW